MTYFACNVSDYLLHEQANWCHYRQTATLVTAPATTSSLLRKYCCIGINWRAFSGYWPWLSTPLISLVNVPLKLKKSILANRQFDEYQVWLYRKVVYQNLSFLNAMESYQPKTAHF